MTGELDRRQRLGACLLALCEVFNEPVSPVRTAATAEALADLPIDALEAAAKRIIRDDQFFPRPARWREVALEVRREQAEAERRERAQGHELPQDLGTWEEHREQVKRIIADLGVKLAWPRPARAPQKRHLRVMGRG